jgi:hypothetical protein
MCGGIRLIWQFSTFPITYYLFVSIQQVNIQLIRRPNISPVIRNGDETDYGRSVAIESASEFLINGYQVAVAAATTAQANKSWTLARRLAASWTY